MARKDHRVPIRSGSTLVSALRAVATFLCAGLLAFVLKPGISFAHSSDPQTAVSSDMEIYRRLSSDEVAARVLEFLKSKPFPQKEKDSLLDKARPEDRVELKRLLSTWKTDSVAVKAVDGILSISNTRGEIEIEISRQPSDGQIVLNGKPFSRPSNGSVLDAMKKHLRADQASSSPFELPFELLFPRAEATIASAAAVLPSYLYIEFASAGETPSKSHTAEEEAVKSAQQLQAVVMPDGGNALTAFAKRYLSDTKSSVQCSGTNAKGIVQLAGELYRFESRPNGDVVILPPFENGSAILLKPSRIDLAEESRKISTLLAIHQKEPTIATALELVDGPVRLICERLQLMKSNPGAASMCDKLYQKQISREGRCSRLDGEDRSECLRAASDILPGKHLIAFEKDLLKFLATEADEILAFGKSVESAQIIGRQMRLHQCLDGTDCVKTYAPTALEIVQPSRGEVSKDIQALLNFRHATTGSAPLVKYGCEVQNETCGLLTNTDAAYKLTKKDFESLRSKLSKVNRRRVFKKVDFLQQASALRPLGQCCASSSCRANLQAATGGALKLSNPNSRNDSLERTSK
jgi:hypothetical protein